MKMYEALLQLDAATQQVKFANDRVQGLETGVFVGLTPEYVASRIEHWSEVRDQAAARGVEALKVLNSQQVAAL